MNVKKCTVCKIEIDEDNCKKDRNIFQESCNLNGKNYKNNEEKRKYDDSMNKIEKPKIGNVNNKINVQHYENHAYVVIGSRNVGKAYYMLKLLKKLGNKRPIHKITRSTNQCPKYKTSTEIKPINKHKESVVMFDQMLGARNSSQIDEFFTRGRHEDLDVYYISQSYLGLPRQIIRKTVID